LNANHQRIVLIVLQPASEIIHVFFTMTKKHYDIIIWYGIKYFMCDLVCSVKYCVYDLKLWYD